MHIYGFIKTAEILFYQPKNQIVNTIRTYFLFCESTERTSQAEMALNGFLEFFQKGKVGPGLHLRSHNVYIFGFIFYHFAFDFIHYKWTAYIFQNIAAFLHSITDISA